MPEDNNILLICNDNSASRYLREKLIIDGGYPVTFESTSLAGLNALRQNNFDIVITEFGMPDYDCRQLIRDLKKINPDCLVIVFFATQPEPGLLREIADLGIYDFISQPINLGRLFLLIRKGAELHRIMTASRKSIQILREQNITLQKQNILLAKRIEESTKNLSRLYEDLRSTYMRTIKVLAYAIDARDHYTHSHSENVTKYAVAIATEMGLSVKEVESIREACALHDLGKIGIEDNILTKPTPLTETEWEQIKRHPEIGAQILEPLTFLNSVIDLVRQHHEHYDGSGYPQGLKAEDILLGARIINVADAYEAMRSARSYRKVPLSKEKAILEIKQNSGKQFDPKVVEAFLRIVDKL